MYSSLKSLSGEKLRGDVTISVTISLGTTMYMATTLEGRLTSIYLNPSLALASVLLDFLAQPFLTHYV